MRDENVHVKSTSTYKAVFTLANGHGSGAGPTLYTHVARTSGPGSTGHSFTNCAHAYGPGFE